MDEAGQSGAAGAAESGVGADAHDRTGLIGWANGDQPWSSAGAALDPVAVDPAEMPDWRGASTDLRRYDGPGADDPRGRYDGPGADDPRAQPRTGSDPAPSGWSDRRPRYADLLDHLAPDAASPPARTATTPARPQDPSSTVPGGPVHRPTAHERGAERPFTVVPAPAVVPVPAPAVVPVPVPDNPTANPTGNWSPAESARNAVEAPTPRNGLPRIGAPTPVKQPRTGSGSGRPGLDPATFPRRLPYEAPPDRPSASGQRTGHEAVTEASSAYAAPAAYAAFPDRPGVVGGEGPTGGLPQRVPAKPDVPTVPEPPSVDLPAETPALARIATHLRNGDLVSPQDRQEGFDVTAILAAVREVDGVRGATLRTTPTGGHSLRLDLADGADPAEVSRQVARLLQDRMGLDAAMAPEAAAAAYVPSQAGSAGRAPVSGPGGGAVEQDEQLRRAAPGGRTSGALGGRPTEVSATSLAGADRRFGSELVPPRPIIPGDRPGPRMIIENVQVNTFGVEATVEVRLTVGEQVAAGMASGPAVDGYLLRLCAMATAGAVDQLLARSEHADGPARCFVEHAAAVPFGASEVAVVVVLLSYGGWVEQLAGSAMVTGDDRHAIVRATLAAVNRRLEALLS